jgi:hypothetical protein
LWGGSIKGFIVSVHKNKRNLSKLEFYNNARTMREDITNFLLRDFGVRDKVRSYKDDSNVEITVIESYPAWLINYLRENIINLLRNLMHNITAANTIYPITLEELSERRRYQNEAIINCEQLLCELTYCADVLPVELGKFMPYIDKIALEVKLLKGWRKSSNELARKIKSGEIKGGK